MTDKFKSLPSNEKIEYIFDYYKLHIIAVAAAILLVLGILNHYVFNPPKTPFVNTVFYGFVLPEGVAAAYSLETGRLVGDPDREESVAYEIPDYGDDSQLGMALWQKFITMAAANEIDIIVTDAEHLRYLTESGFLTEAAPLSGSALMRDVGADSEGLYISVVSRSTRKENAEKIVEAITSNE